jgi:hypothetical protein
VEAIGAGTRAFMKADATKGLNWFQIPVRKERFATLRR